MDIETVTAFFMWCSIINIALLLLSTLMCVCLANFAHRIHSKWFSISREAFNIAIYSFLGLYKVLIITLNIIPYIALKIIT